VVLLLHRRREPFAPRILRAILPSRWKQPRFETSLWVSRINGTDLHEVGYEVRTGDEHPIAYEVQWLPNGRRISFAVSDDNVYIVQAD
jgi:hypothetical protein